MTWSIIIPWALAALFFMSAIGQLLRLKDAEQARARAEMDAISAIHTAVVVEDAAEDGLVPLTWLWDVVNEEGYEGATVVEWPRIRLYLVATYTNLQKALRLDDKAMTEAMAAARRTDPPPRLPRYPQVPPYLAGPDDVADRLMPPSNHGRGVAVDVNAGPNLYGASKDEVEPLQGEMPPEVAQEIDARLGHDDRTRYFLHDLMGGGWRETDRDGWLSTYPSHRIMVQPDTPPAGLPVPVRRIIEAGP